MGGFPGGAALLLGGLLIVAGALKLSRPKPFAHAVYRLLPGHLARRAALARLSPWLAGGVEVLSGAALLVVPGPGVAAAVALLHLGFVAVVVVAIRKGTSCGCFSSFSDGAAGGAELGRSLALLALAAALLVFVLAGDPASWWRWDAAVWLPVLAAVVVLAAVLGGRARPAGALLLGRVDSRLSGVELPAMVTGRVRAEAIDAAREAPSSRAFLAWLGARSSDVDWRRCEVRVSAATPAGGPRVRCLLVSPRCGPGLTLTVSVPDTGAAAAVVIATVDGRPVTAIGERVLPATVPPRSPASRAGSPPPAARPSPRPGTPRTTGPVTTGPT